jgi:uncharacterized protein YndB with AHSA1/START domain
MSTQATIWIAAPRERVWQAVTQPEQLAQWFAPGSPWEVPALDKGAPVAFHLHPSAHNALTEPYTMRAVIAVVDPPRQLSLEWEAESGFPPLTFLLAEENGGTRVTITQSLEATAGPSEENEGYTLSLENLKALVEGEAVPHR